MSQLKRGLIVLNPQESKRIIARAVARLPEVQRALKSGRLIIGNGTTNAYVAEEIIGAPVSKWHYSAGVIASGRLDVTENDTRLPPFALKKGQSFEGGWVELLQEFEREDVFIKGANALDPEGNVGVLLASNVGGTIGHIFGLISARGAHLIAPVSCEKLVPDVIEAAHHCGTTTLDYADGLPVGMAVLTNAYVITEIEAFELLCGVQAWHIASGGIVGSEGAVTIVIEGPEEAVKQAVKLAETVSSELPVARD